MWFSQNPNPDALFHAKFNENIFPVFAHHYHDAINQNIDVYCFVLQ